MNAKDKAKQLYELIRYDVSILKGTEALINEVAKKCALIVVDEIINDWINNFKKLKEDETMEIKHSLNEMMELSHSMKYWKEVKQEIEK